MKKLRLHVLLSATYFGLITSGSATPFAYRVVDVGPVVGVALNDTAQVTGYGYSTPSSDANAFLTGAGGVGLRVLGPFPAGTTQIPTGINDSGQVSGFYYAGSAPTNAFVTGNNGAAPMKVGNANYANDANNRGQVAGTSNDFAFFASSRSGQVRLLGTLPGGHYSLGKALNDLGQVAGDGDVGEATVDHAFLSGPNGGALKDLGSFGGNSLIVSDVNNLGQVVGGASSASNPLDQAFVSGVNGGALIQLQPLQSVETSFASAINDAGVVVGSAETANDRLAFVYTTGNGMQNLDNLIKPSLGIHFDDAVDVNEQGQILALGFFQGHIHTYLLTPAGVPETASTLVLLGCALAGLFAVRWHLGDRPKS